MKRPHYFLLFLCILSLCTAVLFSACGPKTATAPEDSTASMAAPSPTAEIRVDAPVPSMDADHESQPATSQATLPGNATGAAEAGEESSAETSAIQLAFCGDIYLSEHVLSAYDRAGSVSGILDDTLLSAGRDADLFIANQEFPFGTGGTPAADKQFTFRVAPERCAIFNELGIDLVTLANNHTLDYGRDCLTESFETLERYGIPYIGAGANLKRASSLHRVELKGRSIGFLAASRVIPDYSWNAGESQSGLFTTYDPAALIAEIRAAEQICDFTVVYVHWGLERHSEPEAYQTELAKQYIDAGADLVIGSHPHVLQPIRSYRNVPIVYSLGNYLFGSSIPETELLLAELDADNHLTLSVIPASGSAGKTVSTAELRQITPEEIP